MYPEWNRKQYLAREVDHQTYYAQFLTKNAPEIIATRIGKKRIVAAMLRGDKHMNNGFDLPEWDVIDMKRHIHTEMWKDAELTTYAPEVQARRPFFWSPASNVCLGKAAARAWWDQYSKELGPVPYRFVLTDNSIVRRDVEPGNRPDDLIPAIEQETGKRVSYSFLDVVIA